MIVHHLDHHHKEQERVYGFCLRIYFEVINLENVLLDLGYRVFNKLSLCCVCRVANSVSEKLSLWAARHVTHS
jgi:hypothetical protein